MYRQNSLANCCQYSSFEIVRGDCRDRNLMKKLLADADIITPLAALVGALLCDRDLIGTKSTNYEAIAMLCELASDSQATLIPTTNSGYGVGEQGKFCNEDSPLRPISLYGMTKVEAEAKVLERKNSISF